MSDATLRYSKSAGAAHTYAAATAAAAAEVGGSSGNGGGPNALGGRGGRHSSLPPLLDGAAPSLRGGGGGAEGLGGIGGRAARLPQRHIASAPSAVMSSSMTLQALPTGMPRMAPLGPLRNSTPAALYSIEKLYSGR